MSSKTLLKLASGAIALALSGHAFSQTTSAGPSGTIFLNIDDTTTSSSYVFDTGLSVASFTGTTGNSYNLNAATKGAYNSFLSSIEGGNLGTSTDNLEYSVVGASTGSSPAITVDLTGTQTQAVKTNGAVGTALQQVVNVLGVINNPAGADSFQSASAANGWSAGGYEANFNNYLVNSDSNTIGNSLAFYQVTSQGTSGHGTTGNTATVFAGTWDLTSAGLLSYTLPNGGGGTVPLPAPLLLLLSGLGLMGIIARRGQPGAVAPSFDGAAA